MDIKDIEFEEEFEQLEQYLKRKTISMIGLIDRIGYSNSGYNYLDQIIRSIKFCPTELIVFNAHFKGINKECYIEDLIAGNISLKEVKKMQHQENEERIKKLLNYTHLPNDKKVIALTRILFGLKEHTIRMQDKDIFLRDAIKEQQDVNIFYSTNTGFIDENTPAWYKASENEQRKKNFDYILSINPNAQIYTIGLVAPHNVSEEAHKVIEEQNQFYKKLASEFGVIYVDTSHVESLKGTATLTEYIAFKCIQAMYQQKIVQKQNKNRNIIKPPISSNNNGTDYLTKKSLDRTRELEILKSKNTDSTISFLNQEIEKEKQLQKILKRTKEDYFE